MFDLIIDHCHSVCNYVQFESFIILYNNFHPYSSPDWDGVYSLFVKGIQGFPKKQKEKRIQVK